MAKVLSTKKARKRLVIAVPLVLIGALMLYGSCIIFFGNPKEAVGFDELAAGIASGVIIGLGVCLVALAAVGMYELVKWWVNNGK